MSEPATASRFTAPDPSDNFVFTYDVTLDAAGNPTASAELNVPSLAALVTTPTATMTVVLNPIGLPVGSQLFFDAPSFVWHDFVGRPIDKPDWAANPTGSPTSNTFLVGNPAGPFVPVIAGFKPQLVYVDPAGSRHVFTGQDPTIVNVDPTGG